MRRNVEEVEEEHGDGGGGEGEAWRRGCQVFEHWWCLVTGRQVVLGVVGTSGTSGQSSAGREYSTNLWDKSTPRMIKDAT